MCINFLSYFSTGYYKCTVEAHYYWRGGRITGTNILLFFAMKNHFDSSRMYLCIVMYAPGKKVLHTHGQKLK